MSNMKKINDGKIRDVDIRLQFIKNNTDFFEQEGCEFVNEFGINKTNIVDLALFDFSKKMFYGFEIKSEQDNTKRLYKQLNAYITFFQVIHVIAHSKHIPEIEEILDGNKQFDKIGLIEVDQNLKFKMLRKAGKYDPWYPLFIGNLDLEELRILAQAHNLPIVGSRGVLLSKLRRYVTIDEVFEGIKNKIYTFYVHKCPHCGSKLYYARSNRGGKARVCYKCGKSTYYDC